MRRVLVMGLPLMLLACGPVPLPQAERECLQRARLAQQPRGEVAAGVGTGGRAVGRIKLEVTSDFIMGRDPSAVYDSCVYQKSGQAPSRPLYSFPEWKG
ncbi:hypothetical protein EEB11_08885 [Pseudotabrizicola sediminis]|uniref:Lipoprotein n=1 Tax=Pseudotabrizicola sediminis TaxID=2486418 RepID=A0ABY2KLU1_9RHOB|nr:hypothetical protein [Pseudotabrizicola sediminis]TGD43512.1 hypothetical protein EEB11_08885 [Pseudotabrizicola sediminis]